MIITAAKALLFSHVPLPLKMSIALSKVIFKVIFHSTN